MRIKRDDNICLASVTLEIKNNGNYYYSKSENPDLRQGPACQRERERTHKVEDQPLPLVILRVRLKKFTEGKEERNQQGTLQDGLPKGRDMLG